METIGYAYLTQAHRLVTLQLPVTCVISDAIPDRRVRDLGGQIYQEFARAYQPEPSNAAHLRFALRYEGVNLEVLAQLFDKIGDQDIRDAVVKQPRSVATRRLGFLYEWLTGKPIDLPKDVLRAIRRVQYSSALDETLQFGFAPASSPRHEKYRIIDNLPGTREFCPLVRKTSHLTQMVSKGLQALTLATLEKYDRNLVRRAAAFLYLKETHSSFEVEREKPSANKAQRFADLLHDAELGKALSENRFVELQNAVVDPRFMEASYRTLQNWIGTDLGYRAQVDFVPPRPDDVRPLMNGLVALAERMRAHPDSIDAVVAASAISFGFVFIHPFMDGNGRLHRYLIHESLSAAGFTPKGIILPVSAVILSNLDKYKAALESYSREMRDRTSYDPAVPAAPAAGNDAVHFRYFDATDQASFLYDALERTVEKDLDEEISFLLGFDRSQRALSEIADWPAHSLETFIRIVHHNGDRLSLNKRKSRFEWMTDAEVARFEGIVARSFDLDIDMDDINPPTNTGT